MVEFHREDALAACDGAKIRRVAEHFAHGDVSLDFRDADLRVGTEHLAATRGEVADDVAMYSSGTETQSSTMGSSRTGFRDSMAFLKASEPATLKAISEESTVW